MLMDLNAAVLKSIDNIKKAISVKAAEIAQLENELKRHEAVLELLGRNRSEKIRSTKSGRRHGMNLTEILARLPERFTSRDFFNAAVKTKKSPVYLRQTLSRWARQGKIKRLERGKYYRVGNSSAKRR